MRRLCTSLAIGICAIAVALLAARAADQSRTIHLPSSKNLTVPVPGFVARTNSFPSNIAVSPDGHYAALLNQGYGTEQSGARQSIAILDLSNNQLRDFPDDRLRADTSSTRQSYFIGLAFSSDGQRLYASMGSITDPAGEKATSTGNGIAVYKFAAGAVSPERFVKIPAQQVAQGKTVDYGIRKTSAGTAPPYPAGFAVLAGANGDRLLVANNLSDNAVLLDVASGRVLQSFDLSRSRFIPSEYPYTVIANKAGAKAWVSLWNDSVIAELDLQSGKVARWIELYHYSDPTVPGAHPTAMALSPKEDILYVATANDDSVVAVDLASGVPLRRYRSSLSQRELAGSVPLAIALSSDGSRLYVAAASLDAVAAFKTKQGGGSSESSVTEGPLGFIPTEWYPSALAIAGNDLLIATAKGKGSRPNSRPNASRRSYIPMRILIFRR